MEHFDLLHSPLEGRNLIEASAGTGKTYTIAGLYLRLLLEKRLCVDQILVVTFTEAATAELRGRIREKIREALDLLASQTISSQDSFLLGLKGKCLDAAQAQILLTNALRCFDEAAVFTIHGFCRRILQDKVFECGSSFAIEFLVDQSPLLQEIIEDFWRLNFYPATPHFISYAKSRGWNLARLASLAQPALQTSSFRLIPAIENKPSDKQEALCQEAIAHLAQAWPKVREEVRALLLENEGLNRTKYKPASLPLWLGNLDRYLAQDTLLPLFEKAEKFTLAMLKEATKKGGQTPCHPFFEEWTNFCAHLNELAKAYDQQLLGLKKKCLNFVRTELSQRKRDRNLRSFDDLLTGLHQALTGGSGSDLVRSLRAKYPAALIDEFQDTDPLQYAIFSTIYPDQHSRLFLIGDPKQAIYSFRGADIFAYMEASQYVDRRYTLSTNWRSGPGLIKAINTLFSLRENPFVFEQIPFHPVQAASANNLKAMTFDGCLDQAPLQLWFLSAPSSDGATNQAETEKKAEIEKRITKAVSSEIGRLIEAGRAGQALLEGHPIEAGDLAVLVRTNRQARLVHEALKALGLPSVLYSSESLFASKEAKETIMVLAAIAQPTNERRLKAAMTTEMLGVSGDELAGLIEDSRDFGLWIDKFSDYHTLWLRQGFMIMAQSLLAKEKIRGRLLAYSDGERRLTNLLHCFELLHQAGLKQKLGAEAILKWLARQIEECPDQEEYQIRLETDEKAIKIVTIHKSKGLEYPIVFCPFCWGGSKIKDQEMVSFHDQGPGRQVTLDLGSEDFSFHQSLAEQEILAENLRLLYVALTRAKGRCYLVWGQIKGGETSAPAYLLHPFEPEPKETGQDPLPLIDSLAERISGLNQAQMLAELENLAHQAEGNIQIGPLPEAHAKVKTEEPLQESSLTCKSFSGVISSGWRITSFSSLTAHQGRQQQQQLDWPGFDETDGLGVPLARQALQIGEYYGHDEHEEYGEHSEPSETGEHSEHGMPSAPSEHGMPSAPSEHGEPSEHSEHSEPAEHAEHRSGELTIADFPRGTTAGLCLHSLLEHFDFGQTDQGIIQNQVKEGLLAYGFEEIWLEPVCSMIKRLLSVPLKNAHGHFTLSSIPLSHRRDEMEFHFPLHSLYAQEMGEILSAYGGPDLAEPFPNMVKRLNFTQVKGFLKGFIDLVIHYQGCYFLIDWKSNFLGLSSQDYQEEALAKVMAKEYYLLQAHLYAVALHRHLGQRLAGYQYHQHFGGIYYLFLRGVEAKDGSTFGVYHTLPPFTLIEALSNYFKG